MSSSIRDATPADIAARAHRGERRCAVRRGRPSRVRGCSHHQRRLRGTGDRRGSDPGRRGGRPGGRLAAHLSSRRRALPVTGERRARPRSAGRRDRAALGLHRTCTHRRRVIAAHRHPGRCGMERAPVCPPPFRGRAPRAVDRLPPCTGACSGSRGRRLVHSRVHAADAGIDRRPGARADEFPSDGAPTPRRRAIRGTPPREAVVARRRHPAIRARASAGG